MPDLVTLEEIEDAARRLSGVAIRTPLVPLRGTASSAPLLLKAESLQPVGSFKLRGAYAAISALPEEDRKGGVIAHSSGNHAQAVAYAANVLGILAVLVVPTTIPAVKMDACRALGAEIVFVEPTIEARVETADRLAAAHGYALIPPFDDPRIIAGQGTIGLEILDEEPEVDAVFVPISGGGLISGIATAIKAKRPETKVIGVEPELAADAQASFRAGRRIGWPAAETGRTIADALRLERVGELPFEHIRAHVDDIITVGEDEIRAAMRLLARGAGLVAEPGGAVATAGHLTATGARGRHHGGRPQRHVAVVSGANVDPKLYAEILGEPHRPTGSE
ncbi:threonine/serine dehydratase [Actinoallomurus purpureus]|uniref:threonine ammonia-lyase n=1 Tax=Actinoallomurus purpureus TaxID=478114 RepID=UPI0020929402|nr:threonine/serine dehydratase [Actinoallomurus purpureus]MCO6004408.1 threonine/serine dehydratase [Actinoallomurus purpureus]